jgi:hypothetical protein
MQDKSILCYYYCIYKSTIGALIRLKIVHCTKLDIIIVCILLHTDHIEKCCKQKLFLFLTHYPYFEKIKAGLCGHHAVNVSVRLHIAPINFSMLESIFMKRGMYIQYNCNRDAK